MALFGTMAVGGYIEINSELNKYILTIAGVSAVLWIITSVKQSVDTIKSSDFLKELSLSKKIILVIAFPPYFILHTIAALYSILDLIRRPFYWSKTQHGITKKKMQF
jgi:hypothetical protein